MNINQLKKIGNIFGADLFVASNDENVVKACTDWVGNLEAREHSVRNKEIELDLSKITSVHPRIGIFKRIVEYITK